MVTRGAIYSRSSLTMTVYTPAHLHRRNSLNNWHFAHLSMTLVTSDPAFNMALVIESIVVGHYVYLFPRNCLSSLPVPFQLFNLSIRGRICTIHHFVTTHTQLYVRNRSVRRLCYVPVTILTLHLVALNVDDMAEVYWLLGTMASSSLLWTEVAKMIYQVKVPQSGLTLIPYTSRYTLRRITREALLGYSVTRRPAWCCGLRLSRIGGVHSRGWLRPN